jgi:transcription elongation factor GreB
MGYFFAEVAALQSLARHDDRVSKAFTREESVQERLVVPRAPLPDGVTNYVTARGMDALRVELAELLADRHRLSGQEKGYLMDAAGTQEDRAELTLVSARLAELEARIGAAEVVDPSKQPHDEIRFGATAVVRTSSGEERRYQIVGVDEADAGAGRVAFVAPLARALLGKRVGDAAVVRTPRAGEEDLEILSISYQVLGVSPRAHSGRW